MITLQTQVDVLSTALRKAESEKGALAATVASRDAYIGSLNVETLRLRNQVTDLQTAIAVEKNGRAALAVQLSASEKIVAARDAQLATSNATIATLTQQLMEARTKATTDSQLRAEIENVRLKNVALDSELSRKNADLSQVTSDYASVQLRYNALKSEAESLSVQAAALQKDKDALAQENAAMNARTRAAFSADKFADYLSRTIDRFNDQVNASTPSVNYVINELDVELKAIVGKSDTNEMIMAAPPLGSSQEQALSTVRLSIRSVPKE